MGRPRTDSVARLVARPVVVFVVLLTLAAIEITPSNPGPEAMVQVLLVA